MAQSSVWKETACIEWTGNRMWKGYGTLRLDGKNQRAHRVSYQVAYDVTLTPDDCVCHYCDNPPCINPTHLFIGTVQDNNADRFAKGKYKRKLDDNTRSVVVVRYQLGEGTHRSLAAEYGVSHMTIGDIVRASVPTG